MATRSVTAPPAPRPSARRRWSRRACAAARPDRAGNVRCRHLPPWHPAARRSAGGALPSGWRPDLSGSRRDFAPPRDRRGGRRAAAGTPRTRFVHAGLSKLKRQQEMSAHFCASSIPFHALSAHRSLASSRIKLITAADSNPHELGSGSDCNRDLRVE